MSNGRVKICFQCAFRMSENVLALIRFWMKALSLFSEVGSLNCMFIKASFNLYRYEHILMYSAGYFNQSKLPMMPCFVSIASSKSVGVGVYDKPMNRGYQMQDRYVEGICIILHAWNVCHTKLHYFHLIPQYCWSSNENDLFLISFVRFQMQVGYCCHSIAHA